MMIHPNAGAPMPTTAWSYILVPTDFIGHFKADINTIAEAGFVFQDERVKDAAKRALCSIGMAFGGIILGVTAWNLIWYTLSLATKIAVGAGLYFVCRDYLERSNGESGVIAVMSEYQSKVQGIFKLALALRNYLINAAPTPPAPPTTNNILEAAYA